MQVVVYDEEDRRYVPVLLVGLLVVLVAVLSAVLARSVADPPARAGAPVAAPSRGTSEPQAGTSLDEQCVAALQRADAALERGTRLGSALAKHTAVVDDQLAGRLSAEKALQRQLPLLTTASTERRLYADDLAAYRAARSACRS